MNSLLCQTSNTRKRRNIETIKNDIDHDLLFTPWFDDKIINTTSIEKACITLTRIFSFLNSTGTNIKYLAEQGKSLKDKIPTHYLYSSDSQESPQESIDNSLKHILKLNVELLLQRYSIKNITPSSQEQYGFIYIIE